MHCKLLKPCPTASIITHCIRWSWHKTFTWNSLASASSLCGGRPTAASPDTGWGSAAMWMTEKLWEKGHALALRSDPERRERREKGHRNTTGRKCTSIYLSGSTVTLLPRSSQDYCLRSIVTCNCQHYCYIPMTPLCLKMLLVLYSTMFETPVPH